MNTLLQKKINLLVHLAKADGHLDESEKKLIQEILVEAGEQSQIDWSQSTIGALEVVNQIQDKEKLLHWALRLIKIDGILHADEIAYCKALAIKLKFRPELIDRYTNADLPELDQFVKSVNSYRL